MAASNPNAGKSVRDMYKLGRTLGTGGFSVVKLATEKSSGKEWACKIMTLPKPGDRPKDDENTREDIFYEIDILCRVKHESVMLLKEYFEEDDKVYLITELLTGGELLDAVIDRGCYTEEDARQVTYHTLLARAGGTIPNHRGRPPSHVNPTHPELS